MSLFRIIGISREQLVQTLRAAFPNSEAIEINEEERGASELNNSNLKAELEAKSKELVECEATCSKALLSIQSFHKQQQDLFDEFVLLRQKYDEQRNTLANVLWTHCRSHHPELRQIPPPEDPENFDESDEFVGQYIVGRMLGEGQFASVRMCTKEGDDAEYALKIIKKDRIMNFVSLKRMSNEIDTLRKLHSKYIICLHEVIQTATKLYIITEKGGPDLFEFFDEHPDGVPEHWAKEIMYRILRAVQFCHKNSFCHRDLKPEVIYAYILLRSLNHN